MAEFVLIVLSCLSQNFSGLADAKQQVERLKTRQFDPYQLPTPLRMCVSSKTTGGFSRCRCWQNENFATRLVQLSPLEKLSQSEHQTARFEFRFKKLCVGG
jgi:hypothetical protein